MARIYDLLIFLTALGLFLPFQGKADNGPMQVLGAAVLPKSPHQTIRMQSQEVTVRLKKTTYSVHVIFHFFNTGDAVTELIGFPKRGKAGEFIRFDTWVDGKKVRMRQECNPFTGSGSDGKGEADRWFVCNVTFPGYSGTTIRVGYEADYMQPGRWPIVHHLAYEYGTGAFWKDNIEWSTFVVDADEIGGLNGVRLPDVKPGWRRLINKSIARYEAKDFKPGIADKFTVWFFHSFGYTN